MCDAGQVAFTQKPNKKIEVFAAHSEISYLAEMWFKRDACSNVRGVQKRLSGETRQKTLVRLCLTVILIQPALHQSQISDLRDGNRAVEAVLKLSDAERNERNSVETGNEESVLGDQDSSSSAVSSPDLRLRENFTDMVCGESRSRLCRAGVRAPSAELNGTRISAFLRACVRVCACASALERLYCCTACWCAQTGSAGKPQAESTMARMTRFWDVPGKSH